MMDNGFMLLAPGQYLLSVDLFMVSSLYDCLLQILESTFKSKKKLKKNYT